MSYIQESPFAIQIEMTEGCNRMCSFCGINGIRKKAGDYKFMTLELATSVAWKIKESGWNSRIEFAMHGEPTLNPNCALIIKIFSTILPKHQLMMTTNGTCLTKDNLTLLFASGLTILAVDNYENTIAVETIKNWFDKSSLQVYSYPMESEGNPHRRQKKGVKFISLIEDINGAVKGTHSSMNNHCGSAAPLNDKGVGKRCAKPFRELSIRWDGHVSGCCNDFRGVLKCGNVVIDTLPEIWMSERFEALRSCVYNGLRVLPPCKGCDATSYRVGCLPDKLGKRSYDKPTYAEYDIILLALDEIPLSPINKRPWEE